MAASLLLGAGLLVSSLAQGQTDTVRLSCRDFLASQQIDTALVSDTVAFRLRIENMKEPYVERIKVCSDHVATISKASTALEQSGSLRDSVMWIDSTSYFEDYTHYASCLQACLLTAQHLQQHYTQLEEHRLAEERRIAEEKARQEAKRRQEALDAQWSTLLAQIATQHEQILSQCDGIGVSDKEQQKALRDLGFDYRAAYGRYNLSAPHGEERTIARVERLHRMQRTLLDSVLGPNGYPARFNAFEVTLKTRAGKTHAEVYKSYIRMRKTLNIPHTFGEHDNFDAFIRRLSDIATIQQGYLTAITLREEIAANSATMRILCGKRHKDVFDAYLSVVENTNQTPAFATLGEMEMFLESLREFTIVQENYRTALERLDAIQQRNDSIISLCEKPYADMAVSYRELSNSTAFLPTFHSLQGASFFLRSLDDFEQLQHDYIEAISLRKTITSNDISISKNPKTPKPVLTFYQETKTRTPLIATFNNHDKALPYLQTLQTFISLQDSILTIKQLSVDIESNTQTLKLQSKGLSNIWRAYEILLKDASWPASIRSEMDLRRYADTQRQVLVMQQQVSHIVSSAEAAQLNRRLKGEKDFSNIKIMFGIKNL